MRRTRTWMLLAGLLFLAGCDSGDPVSLGDTLGGTSTNLTLKPAVEVLRATVPASGGTLQVNAEGNPLNGLSIATPYGAYTEAQQLTLSYAEITKHAFGSLFRPITPLILVENGGGYSNAAIIVRIPVTVSPGAEAAAFYYDPKKGTLEGITPLERTACCLVVAVRHFSSIVVTEVQRDLLKQGGGYSTFFEPSANGWPFINYGTYPEPEGICAGMSIGAAYFYEDFRNNLSIPTFFDNEGFWFSTPDIAEDDASAYRFTTEIQRQFAGARYVGSLAVAEQLQRTPEEQFWSLCYAMLLTRKPQLIVLTGQDGGKTVGHAILAFAYSIVGEAATISVYDPNIPGKSGTIRFDLATGLFSPYVSGQNGREVAAGNTVQYTDITFMPLSTVCSMAELDAVWKKTLEHTVGQGTFPEYDLYAVAGEGTEKKRIKLTDALKGAVVTVPFRTFHLEIEPKSGGPFILSTWYWDPQVKDYTRSEPAGELEMFGTDNLLGVYIRGGEGSLKDEWSDFRWYKIRVSDYYLDPDYVAGVQEQELTFTARTFGPAPGSRRFEWDFGDGRRETVQDDSSAVHRYEQVGEYEVKVTVFDAGGQKLGEATGKAQIGLWPRIALYLIGTRAGGTSSALHLSNGGDLGAMVISNGDGLGNTRTPITWNGDNFSVHYVFDEYGGRHEGSISGRVSADRSKVISVTGELHSTYDFGSSGSQDVRQTLEFSNFPLADNLGIAVGANVPGPAGHLHLTAATYAWKSYDQNGTLTLDYSLQSIDWNHPDVSVAVWFYSK